MVDWLASGDVASVDMGQRFPVEMAELVAARPHDQATDMGNSVVAVPEYTLTFDCADTQRLDDGRCLGNSGNYNTDVACPVAVEIVALAAAEQSFDCRCRAAIVVVVVAEAAGVVGLFERGREKKDEN